MEVGGRRIGEESRIMSRPTLLFVGRQAELERLVQAFDDTSVLEHIDSHEELPQAIANVKPDVIFCAWSAPWSSIIATVQRLFPGLPVIVVSSFGGGKEGSQVLAAGGFDLLVPPHHPSMVRWAVQQAI